VNRQGGMEFGHCFALETGKIRPSLLSPCSRKQKERGRWRRVCLRQRQNDRPLGWSACCEQIGGSSCEQTRGHGTWALFCIRYGLDSPPPPPLTWWVADREGALEKGVFALAEAKRNRPLG